MRQVFILHRSMPRPLKLALSIVLTVVIVIAVLLVLNAVRVEPRYTGEDVEEATIPMGTRAAATRLAGALQFRTVTQQAGTAGDSAAFQRLQAYLEQQFPRTRVGGAGLDLVQPCGPRLPGSSSCDFML